MSSEEAEIVINQIVETVQKRWDATLRRAGVSDKDCAAIASACIYAGFFYELHEQE